MAEIWNEKPDGTLAYGSVQPGVKPALGKLRDWVDKGYIHKEAALMDETKAAALFTSGRAGIIAGPHWMTLFPLADLMKNVPGAKFKAYTLPKGPDGKQGRKGNLNFSGSVLINKNAKIRRPFSFTKTTYSRTLLSPARIVNSNTSLPKAMITQL